MNRMEGESRRIKRKGTRMWQQGLRSFIWRRFGLILQGVPSKIVRLSDAIDFIISKVKASFIQLSLPYSSGTFREVT